MFFKTANALEILDLEDISIIYPKWMADSLDRPNVFVKYKSWATIENNTAANLKSSQIKLCAGQTNNDIHSKTQRNEWSCFGESQDSPSPETFSDNYVFPITGTYSVASFSTIKLPFMATKSNVPFASKKASMRLFRQDP